MRFGAWTAWLFSGGFAGRVMCQSNYEHLPYPLPRLLHHPISTTWLTTKYANKTKLGPICLVNYFSQQIKYFIQYCCLKRCHATSHRYLYQFSNDLTPFLEIGYDSLMVLHLKRRNDRIICCSTLFKCFEQMTANQMMYTAAMEYSGFGSFPVLVVLHTEPLNFLQSGTS